MPTTTNPVPSSNAPAEASAIAPAEPGTEPPTTESTVSARLLRIQEVAAEVGATARAIRYYEEVGLLEPAARSEGDYRLYDADDLARLKFIKGLRDDAGFSLAEIGQLLGDEAARVRNRERFRSTPDPRERKAALRDSIERIDRQVATLRAKIDRVESMIDEAAARKKHLVTHLAEIEAGLEPGKHA